MDRIGYSTGALARGDVTNGVELVRDLGLTVIELSALRVRELGPLTAYIERTDLSDLTMSPSMLQLTSMSWLKRE